MKLLCNLKLCWGHPCFFVYSRPFALFKQQYNFSTNKNETIYLQSMDTDIRVAPPFSFVYCFGLQNVRRHHNDLYGRHTYCTAIKTNCIGAPHSVDTLTIHCWSLLKCLLIFCFQRRCFLVNMARIIFLLANRLNVLTWLATANCIPKDLATGNSYSLTKSICMTKPSGIQA